MTDQTELPRRITHQLKAAAFAFDLPAGDIDAVVSHGVRRVRRRRQTMVGLSALALVAGTAGAIDRLGGGGEPDVSLGSGSGLRRGDAGIVWRAVSPKSGLGNSANTETAGPLYALSTAPGQAAPSPSPARVLWRSDDGVEWTAVSTLAKDQFVSDLAARGDRLYSVGTGPATAATGRRPASPLLVGWSNDGAKTWRRDKLPIDLSALSERTTRLTVVGTAVAAGPVGTAITAVFDAALDVPAVLPPGVTAPNGWATTPTGVDLLGPERADVCPKGTAKPQVATTIAPVAKGTRPGANPGPAEIAPTFCGPPDGVEVTRDWVPVVVTPQDARGVRASYTWEQLHVDGDLLRALRHQPFAFVAPAGRDRFDRVELPEIDPVSGPLLLDASKDGFDLVATSMGDRVPMKARPTKLVALHSANGATWMPSSIPSGSGLSASAVGRVGGVAMILAAGEQDAVLYRALPGGGWAGSPLAGIAGVPADKRLLVMSAAVGPFGLVAAAIVVPKTDTQVDPGASQSVILASRDGVTWESRSVAELAGRPVLGIIRAMVVDQRATVTVALKVKDGAAPEQVVIVGTPS